MAKYQGHRSWNAWNVALWIGNDEGLYRLALQLKRECKTIRRAAVCFVSEMNADGRKRTPDGAKYNMICVREAIAGLE